MATLLSRNTDARFNPDTSRAFLVEDSRMVDRAELEAEKRAAQADNLIKAWAALRLIYEAVGQHAPPGTLPSEEMLVTPLDYADHIVQGIEAIVARTGPGTKT